MKFSISALALLAVAFACEAGGVQQQQFQRQRQFAPGGCASGAAFGVGGCGQPAQQQFFRGGYQQNFQRSFRQQQFYQAPVIQQAPLVYQQQQVVQQAPIVYQQPPVLLQQSSALYGAGYGVGAGVGFFPARQRFFNPVFNQGFVPAAPLLQFNFGRSRRY